VGGGFVLSPNAAPDDGLLDLFHARPVGLIRVVRYLPGILRGAGIQRPEIALRQGTEIHVERTDGMCLAFELDGELMESSAAALSVRVLPASLPVLEVPR
jgi:diacylglycerol kinase (ATP)